MLFKTLIDLKPKVVLLCFDARVLESSFRLKRWHFLIYAYGTQKWAKGYSSNEQWQVTSWAVLSFIFYCLTPFLQYQPLMPLFSPLTSSCFKDFLLLVFFLFSYPSTFCSLTPSELCLTWFGAFVSDLVKLLSCVLGERASDLYNDIWVCSCKVDCLLQSSVFTEASNAGRKEEPPPRLPRDECIS